MAYGYITWDHNGHALYRLTSTVPCDGPAWSKKCLGRSEDDYGSTQWCPACTYGDGKRVVVTLTRFPQFDAPQPPEGWTPEQDAEVAVSDLDTLYLGATPA